MPAMNSNVDVPPTPGSEWMDKDRRIWVIDADGAAVPTDRFAPDPDALARTAVAIAEREHELQNWDANIALYENSTAQMRDSREQWRERAMTFAPRVETPQQRWLYGLGGAVLGYAVSSMLVKR